MSVQFSNWENRPLEFNQLQQTGHYLQNLVHMIYKLKYLGAHKNKLGCRVFLSDVISKVTNYKYVDNPNVHNKFHKNDHYVSNNVAQQILKFYNRYKNLKNSVNIRAGDPILYKEIKASSENY